MPIVVASPASSHRRPVMSRSAMTPATPVRVSNIAAAASVAYATQGLDRAEATSKSNKHKPRSHQRQHGRKDRPQHRIRNAPCAGAASNDSGHGADEEGSQHPPVY